MDEQLLEILERITQECSKKKVVSLCKKLTKKCSYKSGKDMSEFCSLTYWLYIYGHKQLVLELCELTHKIEFTHNFNVWTFIFFMWGLEIRVSRENGNDKKETISKTVNSYYLQPFGIFDSVDKQAANEKTRRSGELFSYPHVLNRNNIEQAQTINDKNEWKFSALLRMIGDGETGLFPDMNKHWNEIESVILEYIEELAKVK